MRTEEFDKTLTIESLKPPDTILIVEDDEGLNRLISKILMREGFKTISALTSKAALSQIKQKPDVLLLLDYSLPDMNGKELLETLDAEGLCVPFMIMTGCGDEKTAVDMMKHGAIDYITKAEDLLDVIPRRIQMACEQLAIKQQLAISKKALKKSEHDKGLILRSVSEIVSFQNKSLQVIWANKAAGDTVNTTPDKLIGRFCYEIWAQRSEPCVDCPIIKSMESGEIVEMEKNTPDGRIWFIRGFPVREAGEIIGAVEVTKDITDRKKAQNGLLESEERYRTLLNNINDLVMEIDSEGKLTYVSPQIYDILGYTQEEAKGISAWDLVHPDDLGRCMKAMRNNDQVKHIEYRSRHKDGHYIHVSTSGKYIPDNAGGFRIVSVLRDISDLKLSEDKLLEANLRLEHTLEKLRESQTKLVRQERLSALGQMASGIAHDFNNVLMPIIGFSEMILMNPDLLKDHNQALSLIRDVYIAGCDASQIVQRMRQIYKTSDETDFIILDAASLLTSCITMTKPRWREEKTAEGITISIDTELADNCKVRGMESELREVFINLLLNAVDSMQQSGTITIRCYKENDVIVIEMQDTGQGMSESIIEHCMEPYFSTKGPMGSGLGLAVAQGIVTRHGGKLSIESKEGVGTRLLIRLPEATADDSEEDESGRDFSISTPIRILVVDDDQRLQRILQWYLRGDGHFVETAETGHEAISKLSEREFNLVITDRAMSDMNGDELAKHVSEHYSNIKVIMLTGFGEIMKDKNVIPIGVDRLVSKPITQDDLRSEIRKVMK